MSESYRGNTENTIKAFRLLWPISTGRVLLPDCNQAKMDIINIQLNIILNWKTRNLTQILGRGGIQAYPWTCMQKTKQTLGVPEKARRKKEKVDK